MTLSKGDLLRQTRRCVGGNIKPIIDNLIWQVVRINPKTYTLRCVGGCLKGEECKLVKDFCFSRIDAYGIETRWEQYFGKVG